MKRLIYLFVVTILVGGCSLNSGIVKLSPDTYMISRASAGGGFANMPALKTAVIKEANAFAEGQGKVAIPLALNENRPPVGFPSFEYQFRVVDKNDAEARRTHLIKTPDVVVQENSSLKADIDIRTKDEATINTDLYTELMKLEDLRKKNILTESEFQTQKKRLLENQR